MMNNCREVDIIVIELAASLQSTQMVHVCLNPHEFSVAANPLHMVLYAVKKPCYTCAGVFGDPLLSELFQ